MLKIYIDRQKIAENEPAIVVEDPNSTDAPLFCSKVRHPEFTIEQDFSRKKKPVVWIEYYGAPQNLYSSTSKPKDAVIVSPADVPKVRRTVK